VSASVEARLALEPFHRAVASTAASFEALLQQRPGADERVSGVVESLLGQLKTSDALLISVLSGHRSTSPAHGAVIVSILALRIGIELGYSHPELSQLGHVALLHDLGGAGVPAARPALDVVHRIRALGPVFAAVADVIVQVHDRLAADGEAGRVHQDAKIVALAVSYDREARQLPIGPRAWPPLPVKAILRKERARFPDAILKAFIQITVQFPVGALVRLNSGEVARVVAKNEKLPLRPVVQVTPRLGRPGEPRQVDLRDNPFLYVLEFLGHAAPDRGPEPEGT
jgi:HD-GYP domain-containing protein (c-di-GMP phosphodiesterase class II)